MAKIIESTNQKGGITAETVNISHSANTKIGAESNRLDSDLNSKSWKLIGKVATLVTIAAGIVALLTYFGLPAGK